LLGHQELFSAFSFGRALLLLALDPVWFEHVKV
jgi:hypothetical protein